MILGKVSLLSKCCECLCSIIEEVLVHISNVSHVKPLLKEYTVQEIVGFEFFTAVLLNIGLLGWDAVSMGKEFMPDPVAGGNQRCPSA